MRKYNITHEALDNEYTKNQKTYKQIAAMFGCGETLIYNLIRRYKITPRSRYGHMKGRTFSIEHREKLSQAKQGTFSGTNNPNWRGGVATTNTTIRRTARYCAFRTRVLRFKGKVCHQCGKNLNDRCRCCGHKPDKHVHHIKDFANNEELRYSLSNTIVLCDICHKSIHKKQ